MIACDNLATISVPLAIVEAVKNLLYTGLIVNRRIAKPPLITAMSIVSKCEGGVILAFITVSNLKCHSLQIQGFPTRGWPDAIRARVIGPEIGWIDKFGKGLKCKGYQGRNSHMVRARGFVRFYSNCSPFK